LEAEKRRRTKVYFLLYENPLNLIPICIIPAENAQEAATILKGEIKYSHHYCGYERHQILLPRVLFTGPSYNVANIYFEIRNETGGLEGLILWMIPVNMMDATPIKVPTG
jgi:hypothetical protein